MIFGGIDVGTTGCKIALYDENAQFLDQFYQEYDAVHKNGMHEIDFNDIRDSVLDILKSATEQYQITSLGVTSFGETFVMLDENDQVLAPSMLYTDPRGTEECAMLCEKLGEERLTRLTGVKPHQMYSISKIMWHRRNTPEIFSRCKRILLGQDFIVYTLTGNAKIDYSLASRTAAFDVEKCCWLPEVFHAADIDMSLMSEPVPMGTIAGKVRWEIKEKLGIDYDITVVSGCHDQAAAMLGAGIFKPNQAMDGTGTVECIPVILEEKPEDLAFYEGGYSVVPFINGLFACYAFSFTGGAALKWFKDNFAGDSLGDNTYALYDRAVRDDPTGILVLPHFAGAATPYMDNDSTAAFIGITLETTKYDIYKAIMEGTSFEMLLNFNTMRRFTREITEIRATGGGAASDVWLQIKADILNTTITALSCKEAGAAGTAALAGAALGVYSDFVDTISKMSTVRKVFYPNEERQKKYKKLYKKYANLYTAIKKL